MVEEIPFTLKNTERYKFPVCNKEIDSKMRELRSNPKEFIYAIAELFGRCLDALEASYNARGCRSAGESAVAYKNCRQLTLYLTYFMGGDIGSRIYDSTCYRRGYDYNENNYYGSVFMYHILDTVPGKLDQYKTSLNWDHVIGIWSKARALMAAIRIEIITCHVEDNTLKEISQMINAIVSKETIKEYTKCVDLMNKYLKEVLHV